MNRFTTLEVKDVEPPAVRAGPPRVDVHQHLWPAPLLAALRARRRAPRLHGWRLELAGEPPLELDPRAHDPELRARQNELDGVDAALISLSSPLGIELLGGGEGGALLDAWREGALALAPRFCAWAAASPLDPDAAALERDLHAGFVGLQLPASALLEAADYERAAPLLALLERRSRPLFIHPGPASESARRQPAWWAAVVDYVAQMHAAWFAWRQHGRGRHPRLRVLFAILAGLGPLHGERFAARGGTAAGQGAVDLDAFVEVSSYGTRAIDATLRVLGIDQIVNGSDRPYSGPVAPLLGDAARAAVLSANPARLLGMEVINRWM